ncbi:hypothetical protein [Rhizobium sp. SL86]|uniref:hypothetical protein n=1 Tax=Rhizobium sp. SL86 TaxID=2995148 RepID=UPI0022764382|nr:hypothetical protein [Rhizobium sp. SL86]MCY1664589.1 hypothetical protein [Rhizobium sp. SL86]
MKMDLTRKEDFEGLFERLTKTRIADLDDGQLRWIFSAFTYQADLMLVEMTRRGMIGVLDGAPVVPFEMPDGCEWPQTVMTGAPLPDPVSRH